MDTTKTPDDLEALRTVVAALTPFKQPDQERIIRWAKEKLGISADIKPAEMQLSVAGGPTTAHPIAPPQHGVTIKQFIEQKDPKSDNQVAAVVAYYHQFEASGADRKKTIIADDLTEACRNRPDKSPQMKPRRSRTHRSF